MQYTIFKREQHAIGRRYIHSVERWSSQFEVEFHVPLQCPIKYTPSGKAERSTILEDQSKCIENGRVINLRILFIEIHNFWHCVYQLFSLAHIANSVNSFVCGAMANVDKRKWGSLFVDVDRSYFGYCWDINGVERLWKCQLLLLQYSVLSCAVWLTGSVIEYYNDQGYAWYICADYLHRPKLSTEAKHMGQSSLKSAIVINGALYIGLIIRPVCRSPASHLVGLRFPCCA